jgi:LysM repeat protein
MKKILITIVAAILLQFAFAQDTSVVVITPAMTAPNAITAEQYVQMYKDVAIAEQERSGVPAAITLAQGLLETENGNSVLVKASNNHFGIKCKNTWTGPTFNHDDDAPGECFRVYPNAAASYKDHSDFLRSRPNYAPLFHIDMANYRGWAYGLKKAGYATNPKYPVILIHNIETYGLQQYTIAGINHAKLDSNKVDTVEITKIITEKTTIPVSKPDTITTQKTITTIIKTVPAKPAVADTTKTTCAPEAGLTLHEVQQGETLYSIAKLYNVTPQQIRDWNKLTGDDLKIGQQIIVTQ